MRLRITRQLCESIDGIQLSAFRRGYVYDVGTMIGNYLLAVRAAEPVTDDHPYIVLPPEMHLFYPGPAVEKTAEWPTPQRHRRSSDEHVAVAADRPLRRRARRRTSETATSARQPSTRGPSELQTRVDALAEEFERIKKQFDGLRPAM